MKQQPVCLATTLTFKVIDPFGLHARSTGKLLRFLDENEINGYLIYKDKRVKLDSIIDIMRLNIGFQDMFIIELDKPLNNIANMESLFSYVGILLCS